MADNSNLVKGNAEPKSQSQPAEQARPCRIEEGKTAGRPTPGRK